MARRKWTRELITEEIRVLHQRGERLSGRYIQKTKGGLYLAGRREFGGWPYAIEAVGLDYQEVRLINQSSPHTWDRKRVLVAIKSRVQNELSLCGGIVVKEDHPLYSAARSYCGGWARAVRLAGFKTPAHRSYKWTREKVIETIRGLHKNGVSLSTAHLARMKPFTGFATEAVHRFFKGWREAVEAAGLDYSKICRHGQILWTSQRVIGELRDLNKRGEPLNPKDVERSYIQLLGAAYRYFGSWRNALQTAGIDWRRHYKLLWSTKEWLNSLTTDERKQLMERMVALARERRALDAQTRLRRRARGADQRDHRD